MAEPRFSVGDRVRYRRTFLQSIGWLLDVPKDGIVREAADPKHGCSGFLTVEWCSGHTTKILPANVILAGAWEPN